MCVCTYVCMCVFVCLQVHISGREEWKEFPARFCVGVKDFGGREAGHWLSWRDCQSSEEETQFYTTSTFHTRNVYVCLCVCVFAVAFFLGYEKPVFDVADTSNKRQVTKILFTLSAFVCVCGEVVVRVCKCMCQR